MKRHYLGAVRLLLLLLLLCAILGCQNVGNGSPSLKDQNERISYSLGVKVGKDLVEQELDLRTDALVQGVKDGLQGSEPLLSEEEIEQVRQTFVKERQAALEEKRRALEEKNLAEGEAFLRENAQKEGVKTLPSGLQYRVLKPGTGGSPRPSDNVKAHFVVRTIDGKELDSSYKKGQPAVFPADGVIPAWTEVLPLMQEGARWELFVPAALAYGEKGVGNVVGPNQALIFEIELIGIH